jgi:hypothetical protein
LRTRGQEGADRGYPLKPRHELDGAHFQCLALVQCEQVSRHECGTTNAPLRVNDCQFAFGFKKGNSEKQLVFLKKESC